MEADSGYNSSENWYEENEHSNNEIYYSDSESDNENEMKMQTEQNLYQVEQQRNLPQMSPQSLAELLETIDTHIRDETETENQGIPGFPIEYQEETGREQGKEEDRETDRQKERILETVEEESFFPNNNVPIEYQWDDFDECTLGITNPELARRMYEIRMTRKEETDHNEIKVIFLQIQISKMVDRQAIERKDWLKERVELGKRSENLFMALRLAVNGKDKAVSSCKEMKAELEVKIQELDIEKKTSSNRKRIGKIWMELCRDKERELSEIREENRGLRQELSDLSKRTRDL